MEQKYYNSSFYDDQQLGSYNAAKEIFPVLFEYIKPASVLDIGCGVGTWLSVLQNDYQISDILGVDGDYVNRDKLYIPPDKFQSHDLKTYFRVPKKFDLAISVEVGEHLPDSSADAFVKSLTDAADVVLFSAALKGQGGTFHVNEQYPEYWAEKFLKQDFIPIDCIRKKIWHNDKIEVWYRQNILLFIKKPVYEQRFADKLGKEKERTDPKFLTRIHPSLFSYYSDTTHRLRTYGGFINYRLYLLKKLLKK
ncbi:MAG TPA: methyltransferase domain-containing protein [Flavipsychrobacter sp.]|nr:methyltransferase domain-containing protein [Flavipsychrobacter sp.]